LAILFKLYLFLPCFLKRDRKSIIVKVLKFYLYLSDGNEIALVYFKSGFEPTDYPTDKVFIKQFQVSITKENK